MRPTRKQKAFLEARSRVDNDKEALLAAGATLPTLYRWKRDTEFLAEYGITLIRMEEVPEEVQESALEQLIKFGGKLPEVFSRLFDIAEKGKDADALKAIVIIGDWFGISPEKLRLETLTVVQQHIMNWTQMGGVESVKSDGGEAPVEAECRLLPADELRELPRKRRQSVGDSHARLPRRER